MKFIDFNKAMKSEQWKEWREYVFKRDGYTCQICRRIGGYLNPHHIIPKSHDPSKVYHKRNGITLCSECHTTIKELHKRYTPLQTLLRRVAIDNEYKYREKRRKYNGRTDVCVQQRSGQRSEESELV